MTEVPVRVVGHECPELESIHGKEKVNQSIAVWAGLVKDVEKYKTLLDMVIAAGSPSEVWKILLSLLDKSSEAAQDRVKGEFEESSFEVGKETMRDYIARANALVMTLDQNHVSTAKKEINRRTLNGFPSEFDVEKNMFLLMTDTDLNNLGEALTWVEDSRTRNGGADGTHALVTGAKPRGGGRGHGGGARRDRGGRDNARDRRDGKGHQHHHHQQQWASQPLVQQQQQWASQSPAQQQQWASQPPAQQQQSQKYKRQPLSGNYSSRRNHQDILADGDHRAFVCVAASPDISMQNVELYLPHHQTHVPQHHTTPRSTIVKPNTLRLLLEISRLLRENTDTKCPRRRPRKDRRHLPIRPGASRPSGPYDPVLYPRRVCGFEWICV